ncbi:MAG: protein tyrosine phosphatase (PTP) superfamily phosphohydrolase (DUF442 family) [Glaciecola sp.]|jgi:protein tyrosine phosphatase (PTP) superfamily phosphohydrolase (DUF442 family)|uniref:protein tyrosine phosphatase family protein n=1 Tax=Congregibacter sp. TaxID=2744308 RepID=UPI0039E51A03
MKLCLFLVSIFTLWVTPTVALEQGVLEEVSNFHRVSDDLLTAGQIYPRHIPTLQSENVELIINLAVADPERNAEEPFAVAAAGISYVNIPVLWSAPTARDLDLFFAMMDARKGRKTLVHCFANFRASAFTYLYRVIRAEVPEAEARKDLYAVWDEAKFDDNPVWRRFVDETLAAHRFAADDSAH